VLINVNKPIVGVSLYVYTTVRSRCYNCSLFTSYM